MIIPLHYLHAHNVTTNIVLDADTDARVAKFLKCGLEVIGLAVLDPMEVWNHGKTGGAPLLVEQPAPTSTRNSLDHNNLNVPAPQTPNSSAISLSSAGDPTPKARDVTPAPAVITPRSVMKFDFMDSFLVFIFSSSLSGLIIQSFSNGLPFSFSLSY